MSSWKNHQDKIAPREPQILWINFYQILACSRAKIFVVMNGDLFLLYFQSEM